MASRNEVGGKIIKGLIKRFPESSKHALAKKAFEENPTVFTSAESARSLIRAYTGAMGNRLRQKVKEQMPHNSNFTAENPYGLPESDAKPFEVYKLPKANNNILFLSDVHVPYHDIPALSKAIEYGQKQNINTVYINGDFMDCYQASFHEKDPRKRDLKGEFDSAMAVLDAIQKAFPLAKIFYKEGNHEMRWERYLRVKAAIILDMQEFRLEIILKLRERGIEFISNHTLVKIGKLYAIHGNEYKGGGGINVARTLWLRAGDNVIAGDKHKTQSGLKTTIAKEIQGTWSVGCLCELNPEYMPFNEWNHGFAHILVNSDGSFEVHNKQIINGRVL